MSWARLKARPGSAASTASSWNSFGRRWTVRAASRKLMRGDVELEPISDREDLLETNSFGIDATVARFRALHDGETRTLRAEQVGDPIRILDDPDARPRGRDVLNAEQACVRGQDQPDGASPARATVTPAVDCHGSQHRPGGITGCLAVVNGS